eukprot:10362610-Alexandrium_andersonii.AAC.1
MACRDGGRGHIGRFHALRAQSQEHVRGRRLQRPQHPSVRDLLYALNVLRGDAAREPRGQDDVVGRQVDLRAILVELLQVHRDHGSAAVTDPGLLSPIVVELTDHVDVTALFTASA